jgi:hypothetical protein
MHSPVSSCFKTFHETILGAARLNGDSIFFHMDNASVHVLFSSMEFLHSDVSETAAVLQQQQQHGSRWVATSVPSPAHAGIAHS